MFHHFKCRGRDPNGPFCYGCFPRQSLGICQVAAARCKSAGGNRNPPMGGTRPPNAGGGIRTHEGTKPWDLKSHAFNQALLPPHPQGYLRILINTWWGCPDLNWSQWLPKPPGYQATPQPPFANAIVRWRRSRHGQMFDLSALGKSQRIAEIGRYQPTHSPLIALLLISPYLNKGGGSGAINQSLEAIPFMPFLPDTSRTALCRLPMETRVRQVLFGAHMPSPARVPFFP